MRADYFLPRGRSSYTFEQLIVLSLSLFAYLRLLRTPPIKRMSVDNEGDLNNSITTSGDQEYEEGNIVSVLYAVMNFFPCIPFETLCG